MRRRSVYVKGQPVNVGVKEVKLPEMVEIPKEVKKRGRPKKGV